MSAEPINRMEYLSPMFAEIFAAHGIGGVPVNLEARRYELYLAQARAEETGLAPLTFEEWNKAQQFVREVSAQARLKCQT